MNEILRKQLWRELGDLPDEKAYQVLDYVRYIRSQYAGEESRPGGIQRFGELLQEKMRRRKVPAGALRGTMRVVGAADRVVSAVRDAGAEFLAELESGGPEPGPGRSEAPARRREVVIE